MNDTALRKPTARRVVGMVAGITQAFIGRSTGASICTTCPVA